MSNFLLIISLVFCLSLFVALTSQIDFPVSSFASSSSDELICSPNHIFKPNLYHKKPSTANKNTNSNTLYYYKTTHEGEFPNKVYGLFLCVVGISPRSCRNCVRDAIVIIRQQCHGNKEAILWYNQCLVRYSYRPFFSTLETVPNKCTAASNADLYVVNFTDILYQTFFEMIQMATFDPFNKHAIKTSNISGSNIILALHTFAQCIPNLSTQDCLVCLNIAVSIIPSCDFQGKKYGSILIPSCYISYELFKFYRIIRVEAPAKPTSPSPHDHDEDRWFIQVGAPPPPPTPTATSPSAHEDDEGFRLIRGGAPPTPTSPSAHDDVKDCPLIPAGAPPTPNSPSAHDNDVDGRFIRGGGGAPPAPNSSSAHEDNVGGRLSRLTPAEAPQTPIFPSAHEDDEYGRLIRGGAPPTPTSPSAHDDDGQLIPVGTPPTPTSPSAHDSDEDGRFILAGATPTPSSPSACDDDEVRQLIQVGATPTPTSPAHHDENHQIFLAGAGVPNSSTRDKDIGGNDQELQVREGWDDLGGQLNNCEQFSLARVREATQNFNIENKLGRGGCGHVYKGTLGSGEQIAVKRLESTSTSGQGIIQFKNEVISITRLQHKNIVKLLGYCFDENEMLLIYEFMLNKSLDVHLFDSTNRMLPSLDWKTRKVIIKGTVRALIYMHEDSRHKIIHRDIKTSNVLLDHNMNPKISYFGLARLLEDNQSEAHTTGIDGTFGYKAPEYCTEGVISSKLDVYSFGVVLLEIISGLKNPHDSLGLLGYTWKLWEKETPLELMDQVVAQSCDDTEEVLRCIHVGLLCVQTNAEERPSMSSVLRMLENGSITPPVPTKPQFYGSILQEASQQ
ncbi:hypothetical protein Ddye_004090 [Dipteronia dyeriana]|uniref:Cysteine-rich receptor-like protein kinase 10 n=1 Tax=Dipteronia dyeriana TaxID=168575 RepID=A0AAE0CVZ6_9ROSI|nr:hypothetical protein Ddye_004090 [Dipteronia dyeriana]